MNDTHHHLCGDRPHAEPERVEPAIQGRADSRTHASCRATHATQRRTCKRRVSSDSSRTQPPTPPRPRGAGARRTARPGQALQSVHSLICQFVSHSLRRRSKLTFFCSQESALKRSLLKLSRLFLQPLVHRLFRQFLVLTHRLEVHSLLSPSLSSH